MTENDLNDLDQEQLNDERLRRMKALMRQLYRDEFETKHFRVPPIKGKTMILLVSFISIIVFGVTTLYNYNRFVTLEEVILSEKGHVEATLQFRANLFTNLFNLALNQADVEREVFHHVANARTEMKGTADNGSVADRAVAGKGATEAKLPALAGATGTVLVPDVVSRLLAIVEQYPDIKSSTTYQQLMDKLVAMEDRVAVRRNDANEAIRVYNTLITTFPWYLLSKAVGFQRYEYYKFDVNDTLLSADVFNRLLPAPAPRERARPVVRPALVVTPEPLAKPEAVAKPEAIARPEAVAKPEPIARPEAVAKPEPLAKPEPIAKPEPLVVMPEPVARPEPATAAEPVAKPEADPEVKP
ncbi:MAG: LemA family protein [Magnetococcales bacterium]|nr:LemA family protein [Magnetococcales bacterium]